jgi:hypothetical protein
MPIRTPESEILIWRKATRTSLMKEARDLMSLRLERAAPAMVI